MPPPRTTIRIIVNATPMDIPQGQTITQLLATLGKTGQPAAVEVNQNLVPKRHHDTHTLHQGDTIEIVTLVGGG
ncbi:MAG: sulfur carrier protein ThiS [Phycisphaerales bacterium]|jgi:thiamine biosynthesis protein ThiS|nr:sulfur carrier protein ThiS [Phycisphaerales bacterium]